MHLYDAKDRKIISTFKLQLLLSKRKNKNKQKTGDQNTTTMEQIVENMISQHSFHTNSNLETME